MKDDDELCLCFHVTKRKVLQFIRVEDPTRPSQLSQCFGAGTGCGWCRPYLERLLNEHLRRQSKELAQEHPPDVTQCDETISPEEYRTQREQYRAKRGS